MKIFSILTAAAVCAFVAAPAFAAGHENHAGTQSVEARSIGAGSGSHAAFEGAGQHQSFTSTPSSHEGGFRFGHDGGFDGHEHGGHDFGHHPQEGDHHGHEGEHHGPHFH